jgi:hypothetical protein
MREVLAAWIVAVFSLVAGLSGLSLHQRDVHGEGIAAVAPRWYSPPVMGAEDWLEIHCGDGIRSCLSDLAAADDGTDPKITQSQGDSASWASVSNGGRAQEPSRC